ASATATIGRQLQNALSPPERRPPRSPSPIDCTPSTPARTTTHTAPAAGRACPQSTAIRLSSFAHAGHFTRGEAEEGMRISRASPGGYDRGTEERKQRRLAFIFSGIALVAAGIGEFLRYCIRNSDTPRLLTEQAKNAAVFVAVASLTVAAVIALYRLANRH